MTGYIISTVPNAILNLRYSSVRVSEELNNVETISCLCFAYFFISCVAFVFLSFGRSVKHCIIYQAKSLSRLINDVLSDDNFFHVMLKHKIFLCVANSRIFRNI